MNSVITKCLTWIAAIWAICVLSLPAFADSVSDFYKGKTIAIQVGYGPGGGYDVTTRLFALSLGKYVPGNPNVVVQNVPGGGGLKVANAIFNTVGKDGLTLGVFSSDVALEPIYGEKQAQFRPNRFAWIGSMDTDIASCGVWKEAGTGIRTLPDLIAAKKTVTFGSSAPGAHPSLYPLFFKNALGAPTKVINGYTGTKDIMLAMQRHELDASCGLFESSVRGSYMEDVQSGNLKIFVQIAMGEKSPLFGDATPVMDVMKDPEMRKVAELVFGPSELTRPVVAPPGTPADRIGALRKAFLETAKDPVTVAAAAKMQMTLQPKSGQEVEDMVARFQATSADLVQKAYRYTHAE